MVREKCYVLMCVCVLKTFAIEAVAPPWFAPVQQQLNNIQQQLNRIDTKASRVCPYPCLLTLS